LILEDREARYYLQRDLSKEYSLPLIVARVNYPGNKNNIIVNSAFKFINLELTYLYKKAINKSEGPVLIGVVDMDPFELKKIAIDIEENHPLGRMFDIDVYDNSFNQVSRSDVGLEPRTCIICGDVAHNCIRSLNHSLDEVRDKYNEIFYNHISDIIGRYARESLIEELNFSPKPGLVTPTSNGSHLDMDYDLFKKSIAAIDFTKLARASFNSFDEAKRTGLLLENVMFKATSGVNTHKGGIYLLGTLIYAFIYSLMNKLDYQDSIKKVSENATDLYKKVDYSSHGKTVFIKYGSKGVLGDSEKGFPLIFKNIHLSGEVLLRKLMSECEDTTILHRHGRDTLDYVHSLSNSSVSLEEMNNIFVKKNISPGGSADLYAGVVFVNKLKGLFI